MINFTSLRHYRRSFTNHPVGSETYPLWAGWVQRLLGSRGGTDVLRILMLLLLVPYLLVAVAEAVWLLLVDAWHSAAFVVRHTRFWREFLAAERRFAMDHPPTFDPEEAGA